MCYYESYSCLHIAMFNVLLCYLEDTNIVHNKKKREAKRQRVGKKKTDKILNRRYSIKFLSSLKMM